MIVENKELLYRLINAIDNNNLESLNLVIKNGVDVNAVFYHHNYSMTCTPLILAAWLGNVNCLTALIKAKANINSFISDSNGSALHIAAEKGHINCLRELIKADAYVNAPNKYGETPLMIALSKRQIDCAKALIDVMEDVNFKTYEYKASALYFAAQGGYNDCVKKLIEKGAVIDVKDIYGQTPLILALTNGHTACALTLIDAMVDVNARTDKNVTALQIAAKKGDMDCLDKLIEKGGDVYAQDFLGNTSLLNALWAGHTACALKLIDIMDDVNSKTFEEKASALMIAAQKGYKDCVKELIKKGADVNALSAVGETPLTLAIAKGHVDCALELIEAHADVNLSLMKNNFTALHFAARNGDTDLISKLIRAGAMTDAKDIWGFTPSDYHSSKAAFEILLKFNADIGLQDQALNNAMEELMQSNFASLNTSGETDGIPALALEMTDEMTDSSTTLGHVIEGENHH